MAGRTNRDQGVPLVLHDPFVVPQSGRRDSPATPALVEPPNPPPMTFLPAGHLVTTGDAIVSLAGGGAVSVTSCRPCTPSGPRGLALCAR